MFSKRCFSEWCAERAVRTRKGRKHQIVLNTGVLRRLFCPSEGVFLSQAEVRNLKNTVWKTPFGTLRVKRENGFTKTLLPLLFQGFSAGDSFSESVLRFTKMTDFLLASQF